MAEPLLGRKDLFSVRCGYVSDRRKAAALPLSKPARRTLIRCIHQHGRVIEEYDSWGKPVWRLPDIGGRSADLQDDQERASAFREECNRIFTDHDVPLRFEGPHVVFQHSPYGTEVNRRACELLLQSQLPGPLEARRGHHQQAHEAQWDELPF